MGQGPEKNFSKEEVQMTSKYMKKYSVALAIREIQIQITTCYTLLEWLQLKESNKYWQVYGKEENIVHSNIN